MDLNDRELEFLVRLVGNHTSGSNDFVYGLYTKMFNSAKFRGMEEQTLDTALDLEDISPQRFQEGVFLVVKDVEFGGEE